MVNVTTAAMIDTPSSCDALAASVADSTLGKIGLIRRRGKQTGCRDELSGRGQALSRFFSRLKAMRRLSSPRGCADQHKPGALRHGGRSRGSEIKCHLHDRRIAVRLDAEAEVRDELEHVSVLMQH